MEKHHFRADPFWVILEFLLARVLDFLPLAKKMGNPILFEIGLYLHTALGLFLNQAPQNMLILIEIEPLALDMQCWYSYLMLFREEDIYNLESCIRVTSNFFNFL